MITFDFWLSIQKTKIKTQEISSHITSHIKVNYRLIKILNMKKQHKILEESKENINMIMRFGKYF